MLLIGEGKETGAHRCNLAFMLKEPCRSIHQGVNAQGDIDSDQNVRHSLL